MRLVTYLPADAPQSGTSYELRGHGRVGVLVAVDGRETVVDGARAGDALGQPVPATLRALLEAGPEPLDVTRAVDAAARAGRVGDRDLDAPGLSVPLEAVRLLAPLPDPPSLRDFYAFETHVRRGFERRGEEIPDAWFELPVYYLTNHRSVRGPGEEIPWPAFTAELDYELEIAMVVGRGGAQIPVEDAAPHVLGYTLYNDCSARDLQRREMQVRLGPARSKGFAQVLGPWIATPDEVDVTDLRVTARLDGELVTDTSTADMRWSFEQMLAYVSAGEAVHAGDVYGSGTVAGGCGLEHGRMPRPGELLELAAEGLGVLRNRVGAPPGRG